MDHVAGFGAQRLLHGILARRGLEQPDGRPLHRLRLQADEMRSLQDLLRQANLFNAQRRAVGGAFLLFASEKFRTSHQGGQWAWRLVLDPLGYGDASTGVAGPLIESGCAYWNRLCRRGAGGHKAYLFTAVLEGGLPTGLLKSDGNAIGSWLLAVIGSVMRHGPEAAELAAEDEGRRLPPSFRCEEMFALGAELAVEVARLRRIVAQHEGMEPIAALNRFCPDWADRFPLDLGERAAAVLFEALLMQDAPTTSVASSLATRVLVPVLGEQTRYAPRLKLEDTATWRTDALPTDARDLLSNALRGRLYGAGALDEGGNALFVAERVGETEGRWSARPRTTRALILPLHEPAEVFLSVADKWSSVFPLPGGEEAEGVLAFAGEAGQPLNFLTSGSVAVRDETVFLAFDPDTVSIALDPEGGLEAVGPVEGSSLFVHALRGTARIELADGTKQTARTATSPDVRRVLMTTKALPASLEAGPGMASLGQPSLRWSDGHGVGLNRVSWRARGETVQHGLDREPAGAVTLLVRDKEGVIRDRVNVTILPRAMAVSHERGSCLRLSGISRAEVLADQRAGAQVTARRDGADWLVEGCGEAIERGELTELSVRLLFPEGGRADLRLRLPQTRDFFVAPDGTPLGRQELLRLDKLAGYRLRARSGAIVFGKLQAGADRSSSRHLSFGCKLPDGAQLVRLAPRILELLSRSDDLDAEVRLETDADMICLRRYGRSFSWEGDGLRLGAPALTPDPSSVLEIYGWDLTDLATEPCCIWSGLEAEAAGVRVASGGLLSAERPWLVWAEVGGRAVSRPGVLPQSLPSPTRGGTISGVSCLVDAGERRQAMGVLLDETSRTPDHPIWRQLRAALATMSGRVPPASLDWLCALMRQRAALAMAYASAPDDRSARLVLDLDHELPIDWSLMSLETWRQAFAAAVRSLLSHLPDGSEDLAGNLIGERVCRLGRLRPELCTTSLLVSIGCGFDTHACAPCPPLEMEEAIRQARCRNDGDWPEFEVLRPFASDVPKADRHIEHVMTVLASPFAAARVAMGYDAPGLAEAIRGARAFDPTYYAAVYPHALRLRASKTS